MPNYLSNEQAIALGLKLPGKVPEGIMPLSFRANGGPVDPNQAMPSVAPAMPAPAPVPSRERGVGETLGQWAKRLYEMVSPVSTAEAGELESGVSAIRNRQQQIDAAVGEPPQVARAVPAPAPQAAPVNNELVPNNYRNSIDKATGRKVSIQIQSNGQYRKWDDMNQQWVPIHPATISRYEVRE